MGAAGVRTWNRLHAVIMQWPLTRKSCMAQLPRILLAPHFLSCLP